MTNVDNYHLYRRSAAWLGMAYMAQNLRLPRDVDEYVEWPVTSQAHRALRSLYKEATCIEELV